MQVSAAITHIRNLTGHDVDGQVNDTSMLLPWIEAEARRLRRQLSMAVPELFMYVNFPLTIVDGASQLDKAITLADVDRIWTVEKLASGTGFAPMTDVWSEVPVYVEGSPNLGYFDQGAFVEFYPESLAPGEYRMRYVRALSSTAFTTTTELNGAFSTTVVGLPLGLEYVVIQRVAALVAARVPGDDPGPHYAEADRIWKEQLPSLKKRYGRSVKQGFRSVKEWGW